MMVLLYYYYIALCVFVCSGKREREVEETSLQERSILEKNAENFGRPTLGRYVNQD